MLLARVGIPESELQDIFDKFVQSSNTTAGAREIGLGLGICKGIIEGFLEIIWDKNLSKSRAMCTTILPYSHIPLSPHAKEPYHGG